MIDVHFWSGFRLVAGLVGCGAGLFFLEFAATALAEDPAPKIVRVDPKLDKLIPKNAKVEILAEGFDWSEGPIWMPESDGGGKGFLLFSDVPENVVYKWRKGMTKAEVFLKPSGYTGSVPRGGEPGSNGLTRDPQGRLVLCQHGDRRVARLDEHGKLVGIVDHYEGKRFNSPNDVVFKSNGDMYFTDPPYGLLKLNADPAKEIPFNGVYRFSKDGKLTLLTKELSFPNGLAFSPDEKILYVANSDAKRAIWMAYPVKEDGNLGAGRVFFDSTPWVKAGKKGGPDGMKVDRAGNLWATAPGGVAIFTPEGTHLGTIDTGQRTANCNWGDDGSTLYITADMYLMRVKTSTKGN
ncbi:MAG: SMP-30/gluconolactonase/LRE family protein [Isosphaeraceae bacterium]